MGITQYENGDSLYTDNIGQTFHFCSVARGPEGQLVALINTEGLVVFVDEEGNLMMY